MIQIEFLCKGVCVNKVSITIRRKVYYVLNAMLIVLLVPHNQQIVKVA